VFASEVLIFFVCFCYIHNLIIHSDDLDCYFIGVDLQKANKIGYRRQLPYELYELKTDRNNLYWSYFNITSIMRPVCFVTTIDSQAQFIDWCHNFNQHFRYNSANMRFWCFPYNYCDRSNWNDVSEESRLFFNINDHVDIDHVREESSTQEDHELNSSMNDSDSECYE
jgi:hypothetical protein